MIRNVSGIVIGMSNNRAIVHKKESNLPNRNYFVVGGPGSYKTQAFVLTNIINVQDESIVVTDPKGEIYEKTAQIKKKQGYDVHVINFKNMDISDKYNPIAYVRKEIDAAIIANSLISSKNTKMDFWYHAQLSLLKALILYCKYHMEDKEQNICGILNFLQKHRAASDDDEKSDLDIQFLKLNRDDPARRAYELGFAVTESVTRSNIIISLLSTIGDFVSKSVSDFTSENTFDLNIIGQKKSIIYVLLPTIDSTWESLINLIFNQMFRELYLLGDTNEARLKYPVVLILDEFPNLGRFKNYEEFLATCRGYGISCCTICQSISQIEDRYGKSKAESILGNCAVKICLGNVNETTAQYFSSLCGKTTVKVDTESSSQSVRHSNTSFTNSYNYTQRNLINPDEIRCMNTDKSLVIISGKKPLILEKAVQFKIYGNLLELNKIRQTQRI